MLRPSYTDLIDVVNSAVEQGDEPVVQSRYSIVIATAKRARQIISEVNQMSGEYFFYLDKKPLSLAISELHQGKVKIVGE